MSVAYKHQEQVLARSKDRASYAFFMEAGTGKSFVSIETLRIWWHEKKITGAIIICPKTIMYTWIDQFNLHAKFGYSIVLWDGFHHKDTIADYKKRMTDTTKLTVLIANADAFTSDNFETVAEHFVKNKKTALVVDESTAFKSSGAERTKRVIKLATKCVMKRLLSGTPITNSPLDIYTQAEILGKRYLGYSNKTVFRSRFAMLEKQTIKRGGSTQTFDVVVGWKNLDELSKLISEFASIIKLDDCVDMPERVFKRVMVHLEPEQKRHYEELKTRAIAYIQGHEVTVVNALSMMGRLLQITSGQLKVGENEYISIDNAKLNVLSDLAETLSTKTIIWCSYVQTTRDIITRLSNRFKVVHISSKMSPEQRENQLNEFRLGDAQYIVLNPMNAAHGLTINEAKNMIYFNATTSLEQRLQSLARNYRLGQTEKTLVIDLVAQNTIEERVYQILELAENTANKIVGKEAILKWFQ